MNQYEKLIELIINEQEDQARELFHQIVVEKSREIYENLIDENDFEDSVHGDGNQVEELVKDIEDDQQGLPEAEDDEMGMGMDDEADGEEEGGERGCGSPPPCRGRRRQAAGAGCARARGADRGAGLRRCAPQEAQERRDGPCSSRRGCGNGWHV